VRTGLLCWVVLPLPPVLPLEGAPLVRVRTGAGTEAAGALDTAVCEPLDAVRGVTAAALPTVAPADPVLGEGPAPAVVRGRIGRGGCS